MKILIYMPFNDCVSHVGINLEIAAKHLNNGDEVHIIQCSGDLSYCEHNWNSLKSICTLCELARDKGLNLIHLPSQNRHELALDNFIPDLDLPDFSSIQELKAFEINGIDFGMAVSSTLISMLREQNPDLDQYKNLIKQNLLFSIGVYEAIKHHIKKIEPDVFYLFNGRYASLRPALRAAQNLGVKTFVHERSGVLKRYSLTEDTYPHDIEYMKNQIELYWNDKTPLVEKKEIARQWFEERRKGKDQSWHSFTKSQMDGALPEGFDPSKRNIAIFNSSEDEFESIVGYQNPIYKNQIDAIHAIINADIDDNIRLYLRIHPNLKDLDNSQTQELKELSEKKVLNLIVIPADAEIDSYKMMDRCEKVITFGSTMGIESVFWKKSSILVGHALYENLGGVYIPKNHDEVVELINSHLNPTSIVGALKYGYWQAIRGHLYMYYHPESVMEGKFLGKSLIFKPKIVARYIDRILPIMPAPVRALLRPVYYWVEASCIRLGL